MDTKNEQETVTEQVEDKDLEDVTGGYPLQRKRCPICNELVLSVKWVIHMDLHRQRGEEAPNA